MPSELGFWGQVLLSIVTSGFAVSVLGWFFHRRLERIRWEEANQGDLAKLRNAAILEVLASLGRLTMARKAEAVNAAGVSEGESHSRRPQRMPPRNSGSWRRSIRLISS